MNYDKEILKRYKCNNNEIITTFEPFEPKVVNENVHHPAHYTSGKIECIEAIESATAGLTGLEAFCTGNAIKYLWRHKHKNGKEDLEKAIWYINKMIEEC